MTAREQEDKINQIHKQLQAFSKAEGKDSFFFFLPQVQKRLRLDSLGKVPRALLPSKSNVFASADIFLPSS
jgi:hypothetical protein